MRPRDADRLASADRRRFPLQMHFQPVVDLATGAVVGFEALARDTSSGTVGPPAALFASARAQGRFAELDWACRTAALRGSHHLPPGAALFVNTDPAAAGTAAPASYLQAEAHLPHGPGGAALVRVLEVTERALTHRLGPLLTMVEQARSAGWRIALDDVGVQAASLSLMPFLRPDVIKLDLRLVQDRTTLQVAEVVNAVAVQAGTTGAVVLAEGIETRAHADLARSMGASLGQGYLLGRPAPPPPAPLATTRPRADTGSASTAPRVWPRTATPAASGTPWQQLPPDAPVRRAEKPLLVAVARWLERQAVALGEPAVLLATFEQARQFSPAAARRYADLATSATIVAAFGQGMNARPAAGVRGVDLQPTDPLCAEWDVIVVGPHFAGALIAHDLGDDGPDDQRRFDYTVTYDRDQILAAAGPLLRRLPDLPDPQSGHADVDHRPDRAQGHRTAAVSAPAPHSGPGRTGDEQTGHLQAGVGTDLTGLLGSALAASSNGLAISDATTGDLPLVYVNPAFERLTGYPASTLLGRNARFLQGPDTDRQAVDNLRAGLRAGREVRATLRNYRPDGSCWWNEMDLVPIRDRHDTISHWVGTQNDVTARVEAETQVAHLAHHDSLTGLANRRHFNEHLPAEIGRAGRTRSSVALLYLDLDDFKHINDTHGHTAGDHLLVAIADRLRAHIRIGDLLVRQGGDEFLLVLSGLPGSLAEAGRAAHETADKFRTSLQRPFLLPDITEPILTSASIGVSLWPHHADDAARLLAHADAALYFAKHHGRNNTHMHLQAPPKQVTHELGAQPGLHAPDQAVDDTASVLGAALTRHEDVQRALGVLMQRHGTNAQTALRQLHALSHDQDLPLEDVARDLLTPDRNQPQPDLIEEHLGSVPSGSCCS